MQQGDGLFKGSGHQCSAADVLPEFVRTGSAAEPPAPKITISVYIDDGRVYDYDVSTVASAREHMAAIVATGYRSVQEADPTTLTHYPPHRITKVKATGVTFQTGYYDRVRGT